MMRILSSTALKPTLDEVLGPLEARVGEPVQIVFAPSARLKQWLSSGSTADLVILTRPDAINLIENGKLRRDHLQDLASSIIGVAVRAGSDHPDISSIDAFKGALLRARSIGLSNPVGGGASGRHMQEVLGKLGLLQGIQSKLIYAPGGPSGLVGDMLNQGLVELGIQQIPELASVPGVDVLGPLPSELQLQTVFTIAVPIASSSPQTDKLCEYLATSEVRRVLLKKGMSPMTTNHVHQQA